MFEYDYRTSVIKNPTGEVVFQMDNVEVPKQWSQIATDILAQKYFRKAGVNPESKKVLGNEGRETSVKQLVRRVAHTIRVAGEKFSGYDVDINSFYLALASKKELREALQPFSIISAKIIKVNE